MTTTTTETESINDQHIPEESETHTGSSRWRITDGQFKLGPDASCETRSRFHGILKRVGRYDGVGKDGKPFDSLEVDLELNGKLISFKTTYKTFSSTMGLLRGLAVCNEGDLIIVEPWKSSKANSHGNFATNVSVYKGKIENGKVVADGARLGNFERSELSMDEQREEVMNAVRAKSFYKERERKAREDEGGAWEVYNDAQPGFAAGGWPACITGSTDGFVRLANRMLGMAPVVDKIKETSSKMGPYATIESVPKCIFEMIAKTMTSGKAVPAELAEMSAGAVDL